MDCEQLKPLLAAYADGELEALEAETVEAHIAECGRCRQLVHDQQRMQHVLASCAVPAVEASRWSAMAGVLKEELEGQGEPRELKTHIPAEALAMEPFGADEADTDAPPETEEEDAEPAAEPEERKPIFEILEPPEDLPAVKPAEAAPKPAPKAKPAKARPTSRPEPPRSAQRPAPSISVISVQPRRARVRFSWFAHAVGAAAALVLLALGLWVALRPPEAPPLDSASVARHADVQVHGIEMDAANYMPVFYAGDSDEVAAVWVVSLDSGG